MAPVASSNDNDSMKPNIGEEVRSTSPSGRTPIPVSARSPGKRIDDIGKLTLGQQRTAGSFLEMEQEAVQPISSTQQVEALPVNGSDGPPTNGKSWESMTRTQHPQSQSGPPLEAHHEPDREGSARNDREFARMPVAQINDYLIRTGTVHSQARLSERTSVCTTQGSPLASPAWL